jgi:DNA-binding beta-propeller fold protein YncE
MTRSRTRLGLALGFALVLLAVVSGCAVESRADATDGSVRKGGDDRTGAYELVEHFWKPAPNHGADWTWGSIAAVAADGPDRIFVTAWGDRPAPGATTEGLRMQNLITVVDRNGDMIENWSQWDSIMTQPHRIAIDPYDPERHVWVVDLGRPGAHEQVLKFTNDGRRLVLRLMDPIPQLRPPEQRERFPNPGPLDFGQPSVIVFLPDGHFLLGDGYQNGRIAKYTTDGEFVSQFGSVGSGPSQFDLIHGIAVDRSGRIYVADRRNHRIQVFTAEGDFVEEWPDIFDPVNVFIDENEAVWVADGTLNRLMKYSLEGELLNYFGAYGKVASLGRPGLNCSEEEAVCGGFALPHSFDVDPEGNLYVAQYSGPWIDKLVPRPGADPARLIGRPIRLD